MRFHEHLVSSFIPDFVEIQRKSFSTFLKEGFIKELANRNPITNGTHDLELFFYPQHYQLNRPEWTPTQAILKSKSYVCKLYVPAQLTNRRTNEVKLQWVLLGNLPLMTKRGHFIINGSPRVVINQLVRSPGIYYQELIDIKKKKKYYADLIALRGTWLRLEIDKKLRVWARMKKIPKVSALVFLQALGFTFEEIKTGIHFFEFLEDSYIKENHPNTPEQALITLYEKCNPTLLKPNLQVTPLMGRNFLFRKFMNPRTYDLGSLGRRSLNKKLGLSISENQLTLTRHDIFFALDYLISLKHGITSVDDIDHLKNRRVKASGELIQSQVSTGLIRLEKTIREKMKKFNNVPKGRQGYTLSSLITTKPINGALREFFGSSPLSQYLDQTNPLAEITHKRRLSSLGPGGISRETAGMAVRGIHPTHYGRICPIETPEGRNAGLVNSITIHAQITSNGFIKTPFYNVYQGQIQKQDSSRNDARPILLSAEQEENIKIAPSDLKPSKLNFLPKSRIPVRNGPHENEYQRVSREEVEYVALSPIQMISIATSLIPFLEHDDATRALMGSNMQRQAVPLFSPERPIIGTGLEPRVVADSGHIIQSKLDGYVSYASGKKVIIFDTNIQTSDTLSGCKKVILEGDLSTPLRGVGTKMLEVKPKVIDYGLTKAETNQRFVKLLSDTSDTPTECEKCYPKKQEALWDLRKEITNTKNHLLSTKANNHQTSKIDSLKISSLINEVFISLSQSSKDNKIEFLRDPKLCVNVKNDNFFISSFSLNKLFAHRLRSSYTRTQDYINKLDLIRDDSLLTFLCQHRFLCPHLVRSNPLRVLEAVLTNPLTKPSVLSGCQVQASGMLVAKSKIKKSEYLLQNYQRSNQDTSLAQRPAVFEGEWVQKGDLLADCTTSVSGDLSLGKNIIVAYMPWEGYNFEDAILISERLVYDHVYTSLHIERYEIEIRDTIFGIEQISNKITDCFAQETAHLDEKGIATIGSWVNEGDILVGKITPIKKKFLSPHEKLLYDIVGKKRPTTRDTSLRVPKGVEGRVLHVEILETENIPPGIAFEGPGRVHIYLADKRNIQVGDKMSGRHGNKGIVSRILPRQDMPYLLNGTPIDIVLNPLGVPSRMNVGQVFEALLGLAGFYLNQSFKIPPFDETYGPEASRSLVYSKLYEARLKSGQKWLFNPNFPGKTRVFDGRTGQCFDQSVTVGQPYMLKLIHLVDDKIHARSTGPYSLVTQQPLRGRSKHGGQRLGEMEVWALEGFGAAYTLNELLTIKSDDINGRHQVMNAIFNDKPINLGTPESFRVLIRELQSLCLDVDIKLNHPNGKAVSIDVMKLP